MVKKIMTSDCGAFEVDGGKELGMTERNWGWRKRVEDDGKVWG